ncbi:MAG: histidine phosphatase family protein [Planctomycetes bacterium]|nr:histidine phosphatase family protein [Planctomycetota bacterium]
MVTNPERSGPGAAPAARIDEVWLVRHGQTAANRAGIVQGHRDEPLDPDGEEQARRLGRDLAMRGVGFAGCVASDLARAVRTAELACAPLGLAIAREPALREQSFGAFEGGPVDALRAFRDQPVDDPEVLAPPHGESPRAMQQRVLDALRRWTERAEQPAARLLVVTHGGPIAAVVCALLGVPVAPPSLRAFRRDNTGVTILRRRARAPDAWQIAVLNDLRHLGDGAAR